MSAVYITGHRNPDLDSLCSVLAYAEFKAHVDPDTRYIPVRCGAMGKGGEGPSKSKQNGGSTRRTRRLGEPERWKRNLSETVP